MLFAILAASAAAQMSAEPQLCRVLIVEKRMGEAVFADELAAEACPGQLPPASLRYDRQRKLAVAVRDLAAGEVLGLASAMPRPAVIAGEEVTVNAAIGHVVVSRRATALQTVRQGERYFARSQDGEIFVAPAIAAPAWESAR